MTTNFRQMHTGMLQRSVSPRGTHLILAAFCSSLLASHLGAQGSTSLVDRSSSGEAANNSAWPSLAISADGRFVAFISYASNLVPGHPPFTPDTFVHDRLTGHTSLVSVSSTGETANDEGWLHGISADGRYVLFTSKATNLVVGDTNAVDDVFVHDRASGTTSRVSVSSTGAEGNGSSSGGASMSSDGRVVAFTSYASNLVPGDTNQATDVFLHDRSTGTTTRVSVSSSGQQANVNSDNPSLSADGRYVAFTSPANILAPPDTHNGHDVFLRDLQNGTTTLVSLTSAGLQTDDDVYNSRNALSGDGQFLVLVSYSATLVPGDTNGTLDVFLRDLALGTTTRVSVSSQGAEGDSWSTDSGISTDGGTVVFVSDASNLVPGDSNGKPDIFAHDVASGSTTLISQSSAGVQGNRQSRAAAVSADGRIVAFESFATNLVPYDLNGTSTDVFVRDRSGCSPTIATYCQSATTTHGCVPTISGFGSPSASAASGFTITVNSVEGGRSGLIFYGTSGPRDTAFGGGSSRLCVASPHQRTFVQSSGGTNGGCDGQLVLDWNQFVSSMPSVVGLPFEGGETVWAQAWFRDPSAPGRSNLSNALWFSVCP